MKKIEIYQLENIVGGECTTTQWAGITAGCAIGGVLGSVFGLVGGVIAGGACFAAAYNYCAKR